MSGVQFRLTDDQRALRRGMRELLTRRFGPDALRTAVQRGDDGPQGDSGPVLDRALWRELGDAGLFALRLPENDGGAGLHLPEAVLLFEEAGRALLPGPLVVTHLTAGTVPGAAEGTSVVTAVDGTTVEWLPEADRVLGDTTTAVPLRSVDPLTPLHRVGEVGTGGLPPVAPPAAAPDGVRPAEAALLTAALQLGSAARTVELAARYAGEREQFGRPVGSFQAVQHLCAGMLVRAETARSAVYAAAVVLSGPDSDAEAGAVGSEAAAAVAPVAADGDSPQAATAAAKLLADEAAVQNARDCLQVHGGMGFTWESDVHLHLKRAWLRATQWQQAADAEEELAAALAAESVATGR